MEIITNNYNETIELGYQLGKLAKSNMIFCLNGTLGAGKTTLTKGIGQGLGIKKVISSPTFTIMKIYQGIIPLYHLDCYRLEGLNQDLGFEEYLDDDGLAVVEWSDSIKNLIDEYLEINIEYLSDDQRKITLLAYGLKYENLLKELN